MRQIFLALALALCSTAATAQAIGIQFANIPVGTTFYYETDDKFARWNERYVGKRGKHHVMETRFSHGEQKLYKIAYYNEAGLLVKAEDLQFDAVRTYDPFDCERSTAKTCSHLRTYDKKGKKASLWNRQFESRKSGKNLLVIRNADSNRLKRRYTFDKRGVITRVKNISKDLSKGHKLVKETRPQ